MSDRTPMAPHKEQDGFVYGRMKRIRGKHMVPIKIYEEIDETAWKLTEYVDEGNDTRIVSSRRVEEAVETADYLKRCGDEDLVAVRFSLGSWRVGGRNFPEEGDLNEMMTQDSAHAPTLREAYHRYKAAQSCR